MKIKSIKLHNFMRYKGDNELRFSTDSEKNVTIVLGDNTFGKTTLAQAFRWALYENLNDTSYTKRKDIVLLNNEVAAELRGINTQDVYVEIVIENEEEEVKFVRRAMFNKKTGNPNDISVKQIGSTQLTMQIKPKVEGVWGTVIDNSGDNVDPKKYKTGCVQEAIDSMLPPSLSNYFFFDGERWNDLKSKTSDIKSSVDTILGVSGLLEMMNHLKDNRTSVTKKLREKLRGTSGEYDRLQREIRGLEDTIAEYESELVDVKSAIDTTERTVESTQKTLNDNRKVEEDQKELKKLESDIARYEKFKADYYADIVKELSNSAKLFAATLLPEFEELLEQVDLEGKDIPGVTVDTIEYLLDMGECLCGTKLTEDSPAYQTMLKLKKQVPPEMLGGAAGKLKATLEAWKNETSEMKEAVSKKAEDFDVAQDTIDDKTTDKERLEKTIDRKTNLGPVRLQNKQAKDRLASLRNKKATYEMRLENAKENKKKKESQLDAVAVHDKQNAQVYRCLAYVDAMYEKASRLANARKNTTIKDLNDIIEENFQRMFNDKEKYARLGDDYKVHVYYHQVGGLTNYEEENLSNGETIAINFVFIVSILELARRYREMEESDEEYGMQNAILGLPLVLDGPFSALSNENTTLVANRLPQFAEQVIIFMLDKDWEASGLEQYTLPEYCYRVSKEPSSNSSSLEHE
ncbi:MAG: AAA family ATPase [Ruminococcus flavefaciens]|nr:AAA family ATPase [Ruminococcus flavefaciens]